MIICSIKNYKNERNRNGWSYTCYDVLNTYSVIGTVNLIIVIFYIQSAITEPNNKFVLKPDLL